MHQMRTYNLPPPALSGSGSKGTSQHFSAPGNPTASCFQQGRQMERLHSGKMSSPSLWFRPLAFFKKRSLG